MAKPEASVNIKVDSNVRETVLRLRKSIAAELRAMADEIDPPSHTAEGDADV